MEFWKLEFWKFFENWSFENYFKIEVLRIKFKDWSFENWSFEILNFDIKSWRIKRMTGTCTSGWYTGGWPCICRALMERQLACNCDCFAGAELTFSSSLLNSTIDCFQSHLVCPYTLIMKSLTQSFVSWSITLNSLTQI